MGEPKKIGDSKLAERFMELAARRDEDGLESLCRKARMNDEQCRLSKIAAEEIERAGCKEHRFDLETRDILVRADLSDEFIDKMDTSCPYMARAKWFLETFDDFTVRGQMAFLNDTERYGLFNDALAAKLVVLAEGSCRSRPGPNGMSNSSCRELQLKSLSLLVKHFGDIKEPSLRKAAAEIIVKFKDKELPELVTKLRENSIDVKETIIIFGDIGREDSIPYMLELMRDPPAVVVVSAPTMAEAFRNMQVDGLNLLVELIRENHSPDSVKLAFLTLAPLAMEYRGAMEDVGPVLQDVLDICFSGDDLVIMEANAITALASIDPRPLINAIKEKDDKGDAVSLLAETNPPKDKEMNALFFDSLKELALSEDPYIRGMAFRGLAKLPAGRTDLLEFAVAGLLSGDIELKKGAMIYLGSRRGAAKDAIPILENMLNDQSQAEAHVLASETIGMIIQDIR